ncbi:MAG: putative Ig domain-containing protein [Acidobacteria bacterium]|nr:putative Ig domain-containing protein [Acidobacteriota bacterium]MBI3664223.1 putative Ig domain-containing protein [Acidobacteriota bacterium]
MSRRVFLAVVCILALAFGVLPGVSADEGKPIKGLAGPAQGVVPTVVRPTPATAKIAAGAMTETEQERENERSEPEPRSEFSKVEMLRLKAEAKKYTLKTGGREIHLDATPSPLAPNMGTNFNGIGQSGSIPYDAAIAVGPSNVLLMTNTRLAIYDRNGSQLSITTFSTFWGSPAGTPFDPKCFYDAVAGRWVMLAVSQTTSGNLAYYHLAISQTGDPTGAWYKYQFDARVDGTTMTSNWADFPGLGYDDNAVYVTSNQFSFSNVFQYAKLRVFKKSEIYAGATATFTDFTNMLNQDSTKAFTLQPMRALSPSSVMYLLNSRSGGGSNVTLWRVDNPTTSPTLTRQATITVGAYGVPPDAPQKSSSILVATNDSRMYDLAWRSNVLHASFGESFSSLAAMRYLRVNTSTSALLKDITFTQSSTHYYFPAVTDDAAGNIYFVFSRSSSTEYASVYQTGMTPADTSIQPSALVKAGLAAFNGGRWGDYSGIANDPNNNLAVSVYGGWANTPTSTWATWVANTTFSGSTPVPTLVSVTPSSGIQGTNVNVSLAGQNTNWVQGTSVINISGSGVTASNVTVTSATAMTATFNITAGAATGSRNVTVTTGAEVTTSAPFTVNSSAVPPTLSSISPVRGYLGTTTTVTLIGTNLVAGMTVNVSGTLVTASNVNVASSTQATADLTVDPNAALGSRTVSVTTAGGTSGTVTWKVVGVPVINSMSPNNGNPGATVSVTLLGSEFLGGNVNISGTGVTLSSVQILNGGTKITFTATIAANAAAGGRNVTVTNGSGTSNAVVFSVNGGTNPPTLNSVTPSNGDPNTSVNVTLAGTNFTTTSAANVSGGDVTVTNVNVVNNGQITATFNINPAAPAGARSVTITTGAGTSNAVTFTVNGVSAGPSITTTSLPNGQINAAYNSTVAATGGTTPYGWSITAGALPGGLGLNPGTGAISGTPNAVGTFNFTVTVTDANSQTASKPLSITITAPAPTLASIGPATGNQGTVVPVTLTGTNLFAPATLNISGTGVTASNVVVVNSTTITADFSIAGNAATGDRTVSVTTPGGTTGTVKFRVLGVPIISSISPISGSRGTSVAVTLLGSQFNGGNVSITGTGVTISNVQILNGATKITMNLTISSTAPTGPRSITVSNAAGTSNAVTFTVN